MVILIGCCTFIGGHSSDSHPDSNNTRYTQGLKITHLEPGLSTKTIKQLLQAEIMKYTTQTVLAMLWFAHSALSQLNDRPSYIIHYTGTVPFNDTVKTYIYLINDSILLVEETIIMYNSDNRNNQFEETKEYAPWYYYWVNRKTQRHKLFKVDFQGAITFEGEKPMGENTDAIDFLYGGEEPAFTTENYLNKSNQIDSGDITIISTTPDRYPDFTTKYYFKKRSQNDSDIPSLSPKADQYLNSEKYCYMTIAISNKDSNYYGKTEIFRNYSVNLKQKITLQKLLDMMNKTIDQTK